MDILLGCFVECYDGALGWDVVLAYFDCVFSWGFITRWSEMKNQQVKYFSSNEYYKNRPWKHRLSREKSKDTSNINKNETSQAKF